MWTIKFIHDTEKTGVGTIIATNDDFSCSERVDTNNQQEVATFIEKVKARYSGRIQSQEASKSIESLITELFNKE